MAYGPDIKSCLFLRRGGLLVQVI